MNLQLESIERLHLVLLGVVCVAAYLTHTVSAPSVLLGGAVMGGNFWLMRQLFRRLLGNGTPSNRAAVLGIVLLKFTIFVGLLAMLLWRVSIDPLGFGMGATVLLAACVIEAVRHQPVAA